MLLIFNVIKIQKLLSLQIHFNNAEEKYKFFLKELFNNCVLLNKPLIMWKIPYLVFNRILSIY